MKPPDPEALAGRLLDARLHLLDRQVIDVHGVPVTAVDDLELSDVVLDEDLPPDTPAPVIMAMLSGPVLGTRIFGGRPPGRAGSGRSGRRSSRSGWSSGWPSAARR